MRSKGVLNVLWPPCEELLDAKVPLFSLDTCCHQQLLEKEMIFPSSVSKVLLESPATSALKYSLQSVLPGAAKSIEEEGTASPPVMGAQSFPLPVAIMYSSVWDYRAQRENTITQKWTWKAKLFNHFFSLWTCHDLHSRYFRVLKRRTKETRNGCSRNVQFIFLSYSLKTDKKGNSYFGYSHFSILSP